MAAKRAPHKHGCHAPEVEDYFVGSVLPRGGKGMSACFPTISRPFPLEDSMSKLWRRGSTSGPMEAPEPGKHWPIKLRPSWKRSSSCFLERPEYLATGGKKKGGAVVMVTGSTAGRMGPLCEH